MQSTFTEREIDATDTLDCSGMICPLPIYKASAAIAKLEPGEILDVICTDPASASDFPSFARRTGHALLSATESAGVHLFRLQKAG